MALCTSVHQWCRGCRRQVKHTPRKVGKVSTPGARHRTKGATDPLDATPSGHAGESELFGATQEGGFASASLLIQDRNNRHGPTPECSIPWPNVQMARCTSVHQWCRGCRRRVKHTPRKVGKVSTPGARHRTKGATDPLDATPSGHAGESELFGATQEGGLASASLLIQDRNNRHGPTPECSILWPYVQMALCTSVHQWCRGCRRRVKHTPRKVGKVSTSGARVKGP